MTTLTATHEDLYVRAVTEALDLEMQRDERVILLGEDIGHHGGIFTATRGLHTKYGPGRVIDTPISEAGFIGLAAGAAIAGFRPVAELMFVDFALVAADQLFNTVAKLRYLGADRFDLPLTIRTQQGMLAAGGPQHSQSLEALFAHIPGIAVATPATAADAKGLLATAIRMDEPTVVIEHKRCYFARGPIPDGEHLVPFGHAAIRRPGTDITLVSFSGAVAWCEEAAEVLLDVHGVSAEVIDLRTVVPLDIDTVADSVRRTGFAVTVQESHGMASMAGEIAAQITERCWPDLKAPVTRIAGLDMPIPYAGPLEARWKPSVDDIVTAVRTLRGIR